MKLLKKLNSYFLYDEETGEIATLSDHIIFYGMLATGLVGLVYFTYKVITF